MRKIFAPFYSKNILLEVPLTIYLHYHRCPYAGQRMPFFVQKKDAKKHQHPAGPFRYLAECYASATQLTASPRDMHAARIGTIS